MAELTAANRHIDLNDVVIDKEAGTVYLADPEMRLDVGAIAKGYATEKIADLLEETWPGIDILLSVGGNVKALGMKNPGTGDVPWTVGITNPDAQNESLLSLSITGLSVVTSGDYTVIDHRDEILAN